MQQPNIQLGRPQNLQFPGSYIPSGDQQLLQDSSGMYNNPNIEKQMAALSAASLAKMANRSAPGQVQSPSSGSNYFGGNTQLGPEINHEFSNGFPQSNPSMTNSNPHPFPDPSSLSGNHPNITQNNQQVLIQKRRQFLNGIATVMAQRNTPLPPMLTGGAFSQNYDPNTSPWKILELGSEPGLIRIAGKEVDLYRIWGAVYQSGGGNKIRQQNSWYSLLPQLGLPEQLPPPSHGSTANFIGQIYMSIIAPFEEAYRKSTQAQLQKAAAAAGRPFPPTGVQQQPMQPQPPQNRALPPAGMVNFGPTGFPINMQANNTNMNLVAQAISNETADPSSLLNSFPNPQIDSSIPRTQMMLPQSSVDGRSGLQLGQSLEPTSTILSTSQQARRPSSSGGQVVPDVPVMDADSESKKRKISEDEEGKRSRQKTDSIDGATSSVAPESANGSVAVSAQPTTTARTRRKITYVPLAREVETVGGRNLAAIGPALRQLLQTRPLKSIHDWCTVDIEALIMSIRSRLVSELSYALTTCSLLSVVRDSGKDVPYLTLQQCPDLFDELLELMEEVAFEGMEDVDEFEGCDEGYGSTQLITMRDLVNLVQEQESKPFASLEPNRPGVRPPDLGPKQRPGDIILAVISILRNWAAACTENLDVMARHPTMLSIILRITSIAPFRTHSVVRPACLALSLSDLITIRQDVSYILFGITAELRLKDLYEKSPVMATRITRRLFDLVSSSLLDPVEACVPSAHVTVPYNADNALQIWTRFSQPDEHRKIISNVIPPQWLWRLFQSLCHRLPLTAKDHEVITKDTWLTYMEKLMMAIYSLAFLASPELKHKFKVDKSLGFPSLMLRVVRRFTMNQNQNVREFFSVCTKRAIETMKLVDDEADMFNVAPTTATPVLSFGVGYGEVGEKGVEKGSGMFGGYAEDITFTVMLAREVVRDSTVFSELESMTRVDY